MKKPATYFMPELGEGAEKRFERLARSAGFDVRRTSTREDKWHIDFYLSRDLLNTTVDVKAMKKVSRKDNRYDLDTIWVEFKNGDGFEGWLYGNADYIAFERPGSFWIVRRKKLLDLSIDLVDFRQKVKRPKDALYKVYTRKGRQDQVSRIRADDVRGILAWRLYDHSYDIHEEWLHGK